MNRPVPTLGHSGVDASSLRVGEVLRIAIGGVFVGFVDVTQTTTLEQVRALIRKQVSPCTQVWGRMLTAANQPSTQRLSALSSRRHDDLHEQALMIHFVGAGCAVGVECSWPHHDSLHSSWCPSAGATQIPVPAPGWRASVAEAREHSAGHENVSVPQHCGRQRGCASAAQR